MDWATARRWLGIMAKNVFDPNQPAYILILARVEELEREKQGEYLCGNCGELMVRCMGPLTERAEAVEAKLARCVEALEEGLLLTASWADVRTHNWRNEVRAALAAAKGGVR